MKAPKQLNMKKFFFYLPLLLEAGLFFSSCQKQNQPSSVNALQATPQNNDASAPCVSVYYQLVVDGNSGISLLFKATGSPSTGGVILTPINGSFGDNIIRATGTSTPVTFVSGIAINPANGTVFATTSPNSNFPSRLLRFPLTNPSVATNVPMVSSCGLTLNVSDIEYNLVNGRYYAINRDTNTATSGLNNRIVMINPNLPNNVICLTNTIPVTVQLRGLTFNCSGQGYVMQMTGSNGKLWRFNLVNGNIGSPTCAYTGVIAPGAFPGTFPEMGLHFDCACSGLFITGNNYPWAGPFLSTDGMPPCIGTTSYASSSIGIKPTVDFARP